MSSLDDSSDVTTNSLSELINALYAQRQKRSSREERHVEGAYQVGNKETPCSSSKKGKKKWNQTKESPKIDGEKNRYPPCSNCKKMGYSEKYCWTKPDKHYKNCKQIGHDLEFVKKKSVATA